MHAHATNGDPDATAQAAVSSIWRNAIESALARDDVDAAGTLHQQATDALSPADTAIVANQIAAAQKHLTGQTYTSGLSLPLPNPTEPLDVEQALAAIDAAHQAAAVQNAADFADNPGQRPTNKHFIDVCFGTARRDLARDKADLDAKVADWLAQPGQSDRPPLAVWTRMLPDAQKAADVVLARNALPATDADPQVAQAEEETESRRAPGGEGSVRGEINGAVYRNVRDQILAKEPNNRYSSEIIDPRREVTEEDVARIKDEWRGVLQRAAGGRPAPPEVLGVRPGLGGVPQEPPIVRYNRAIDALRRIDPGTELSPYPLTSEHKPSELEIEAAESALSKAAERQSKNQARAPLRRMHPDATTMSTDSYRY